MSPVSNISIIDQQRAQAPTKIVTSEGSKDKDKNMLLLLAILASLLTPLVSGSDKDSGTPTAPATPTNTLTPLSPSLPFSETLNGIYTFMDKLTK